MNIKLCNCNVYAIPGVPFQQPISVVDTTGVAVGERFLHFCILQGHTKTTEPEKVKGSAKTMA